MVIGGIQINGLGATDIDNQVEFQNSTTLGGLNLEFHQRISKYYGRLERLNEVVASKSKDPDLWRFESRVAEKIIQDWLKEESLITIINVSFFRSRGSREHLLTILFQSPLSEASGVEKDGTQVKAINLVDGQSITGRVRPLNDLHLRIQRANFTRSSLTLHTKATFWHRLESPQRSGGNPVRYTTSPLQEYAM